MVDTLAPPPLATDAARRLLVVIDESPLGDHVARVGAALAAAMNADAVFHVAVPIADIDAKSATAVENAMAEHRRACAERAEPLFERARAAAADAGTRSECVLTIDEAPVDAVRRVAREWKCSLIAVGSKARGTVARLIERSLADDLARTAVVPVMICREDTGFESIPPAKTVPERQPAEAEDGAQRQSADAEDAAERERAAPKGEPERP